MEDAYTPSVPHEKCALLASHTPLPYQHSSFRNTLILHKTAIKVTETEEARMTKAGGNDRRPTLGIPWHFAAPVRNAAVFSDRPEEVNFPSPSGG